MTNEKPDTQYSHMSYGNRGDIFAMRTVSDQAGFFLEHLRPGMRVLDCGCGSGSITVGIAEAVAPAEVVGFDIGEAPIQHAQELAKEQGISNVKFQVASVYDIPFEDESFDAILAYNVMEHVNDPAGALKEMYRVMKSGGVIGLSAMEFDGRLTHPLDQNLRELQELQERVWRHNGGNPRIGKQLPSLLHEAGFEQVRGSARIDSYGTQEEIEARANQVWIGAMSNAVDTAVNLGWIDTSDKPNVAGLYHDLAAKPGALHTLAFGQAIGWKE